jgi:FKBP-type peptidyl-prolyl cis-trans isomerase FkpA
MKKIIGVLLVAIFFAQCSKENCDAINTAAPAAETAKLDSILKASGITATKDSRGFFYTITNAGTSDKPTICNSVFVKYIGKYMDNTIFEQTATPTSLSLRSLIVGWQEGIPLVGKGGKVTLYLPPSMAYGEAGSGSIPPNTNLIFDIEVVDF